VEVTTSRTASTETIETAARLVGVQLLRAAVGCLEMVEDEEELVAAVGFGEEADCLSTHPCALTQAQGDDISLLVGLVVVRRGRALQGRVRGGLVRMTVDLLEREMPVVAQEEADRNRQRSGGMSSPSLPSRPQLSVGFSSIIPFFAATSWWFMCGQWRAYRNLRVPCDHLLVACPQVIATLPLLASVLQMSHICHASTRHVSPTNLQLCNSRNVRRDAPHQA